MQRWRQCVGFFTKLSKDEIMEFVAAVCFSREALERYIYHNRSLAAIHLHNTALRGLQSPIPDVHLPRAHRAPTRARRRRAPVRRWGPPPSEWRMELQIATWNIRGGMGEKINESWMREI